MPSEFRPRDRRVVYHLGYHGWLSHSQIQQLEFPSYDMAQRRIRESLLDKNYIDRDYLSHRNSRKQTPIFRVSAKGKKLFKQDTGQEALRPRFSQLKAPHRLKVNQLIIELKCRDIIEINGFELEKELGNIRPDAYINYDVSFCLEIDLSGGENKEFIQNKWKDYEREYRQNNLKCNYVVWHSKRTDILYEWIDEVQRTNLQPIYIEQSPEKILKVIDFLSKPVKQVVE
jgi:hypothetical protein